MAEHGSARRSYTLTRDQKLSVGVLGVCGAIALLLAFVQVRRAIMHPFTTPVQKLVELRNILGPTAEELDKQAKTTDTDGDGISDYDELNAYYTSPYLRDSDSDGEPDNIEIAKGEDPNCPKGKTCIGIGEGREAPTGTKATLTPTPAMDYSKLFGVGTDASGFNPGALSEIPPRDAAAIRAYLNAQGIAKVELDKYTDEEILAAYDESLSLVGPGTPPAATTTEL